MLFWRLMLCCLCSKSQTWLVLMVLVLLVLLLRGCSIGLEGSVTIVWRFSAPHVCLLFSACSLLCAACSLQIPKLACMIVVSVMAGLLCRHFCPTDSMGYIMTSKNSWFKVTHSAAVFFKRPYLVYSDRRQSN